MALSGHDIARVKGMLARGDKQHDIAAYFGVNGGRVAEVATGHIGAEINPVYDDLPPPGSPVKHAKRSLKQAAALIKDARRMLENG